MPSFKYKAIDGQGRVVAGTRLSADPQELTTALKEQGLFLMEWKKLDAAPAPELSEAPKPPPRAPGPLPAAGPQGPASQAKVPMEEVLAFVEDLAVMVRTALPILDTLQTLARQQGDPVLREVIGGIAADVRDGKTLSGSFARYPRIFDEVFVSLLAAGEAGGNMSQMLERISAHVRFQMELREKIRGALIYPVIVVATCVGVVGFLTLFILPIFAELFKDVEVPLPPATRVLLWLASHLRSVWPAYLAAAGGGWWTFTRWLGDSGNLRRFHVMQLRLPVVGPLIRNIVLTRSMRTLAALVSSGVPILHALQLARDSTGNEVFKELFGRVAEHTAEGKGLASALEESPFVPEAVRNMVANAEKTGSLPEVLNRVSEHYEKATDSSIKNLFSAVEPLMVVFLGAMIALIATAVLVPIFDLSEGIE